MRSITKPLPMPSAGCSTWRTAGAGTPTARAASISAASVARPAEPTSRSPCRGGARRRISGMSPSAVTNSNAQVCWLAPPDSRRKPET